MSGEQLPKKKKKIVHKEKEEEPAVQQLSHYQLGQVIGKGAAGTVYKAIDIVTGDFVAIKAIPITNVAEIESIQYEINLLQSLKHPNIVKYLDAIRTKDYLNIVTEYVENGSLLSIVKKFGKLNESLVQLYVIQGVIHRDIKGANILVANKNGHVKLADFGVSTKISDKNKANGEEEVAGTPYWMAPEIINLEGAQPASDIWSLGCTIIELLTGSPPYFDLPPFPALYRITQDDHPPLPSGISKPLEDFLMRCFQKNTSIRATAKQLIMHPWLSRRGMPLSHPPMLGPPKSPGAKQAEVQKEKTAEQKLNKWVEKDDDDDDDFLGSIDENQNKTVKPASKTTEASAPAASTSLAAVAAKPAPGPKSGVPAALSKWVEKDDDDDIFPDSDDSSKAKPKKAAASNKTVKPKKDDDESDPFAGIDDNEPKKEDEDSDPFAGIDDNEPKKDNEESDPFAGIDDSFDTPSKPKKSAAAAAASSAAAAKSASQAKAAAHSASAAAPQPSKPAKKSWQEFVEAPSSDEEDDDSAMFDSLADGSAAGGGGGKEGTIDLRQRFLLEQQKRKQAVLAEEQSGTLRGNTLSAGAAAGHIRSQSGAVDATGPPGSSAGSGAVGLGESGLASHLELYAMTDSDVDLDPNGLRGADMDEVDPFDQVDEWGIDDEEPEDEETAQRRREECDDRDRLVQLLSQLDSTDPGKATNIRQTREERQIERIQNISALIAKRHSLVELLITKHAVLPLLEALEVENTQMKEEVIKLCNIAIQDNERLQETMGCMGMLPVILSHGSDHYPLSIRLEVSKYVSTLLQGSETTLQMFVASRCLPHLCDMLIGRWPEDKELVLQCIDNIHHILTHDKARDRHLAQPSIGASSGLLLLPGASTGTGAAGAGDQRGGLLRNDLCRLFCKCDLLPRIVHHMKALNREVKEQVKQQHSATSTSHPSSSSASASTSSSSSTSTTTSSSSSDSHPTSNTVSPENTRERNALLQVCDIIGIFGNNDKPVSVYLSKPQTLNPLLQVIPELVDENMQLSVVTGLRFVCMNSTDMMVVSTDLIPSLVNALQTMESQKVLNQIVMSIFYLTLVSTRRLELFALNGVIPCLQKLVKTDSAMKQLALDVLYKMPRAGQKGREQLWRNNGVQFFLDQINLQRKEFGEIAVFEALLSWMSFEKDRVGRVLAEPENLTHLLHPFFRSEGLMMSELQKLIPIMLEMLGHSPTLAMAVGKRDEFWVKIVSFFDDPVFCSNALLSNSAVRIISTLYERHSQPKQVIAKYGLLSLMARLSEDPHLLIRQIAQKLYQAFETNQFL